MDVLTVNEDVNEFAGLAIPLLGKEGWLCHRSNCEATFEGADGVVNEARNVLWN